MSLLACCSLAARLLLACCSLAARFASLRLLLARSHLVDEYGLQPAKLDPVINVIYYAGLGEGVDDRYHHWGGGVKEGERRLKWVGGAQRKL